MMADLPVAQRFQLAAALDRIAYSHPELFFEADALDALALVPAPTFLGIFLRSLPFEISIAGNIGGGTAQGHSPGMGDVSMREEDKDFKVGTTVEGGVRAGQWEAQRVDTFLNAICQLQVLEVRQVMTTVIDTGTTFRITYRRGKPQGSSLDSALLAGARFEMTTFQRWKAVAAGSAPKDRLVFRTSPSAPRSGLEMRGALHP